MSDTNSTPARKEIVFVDPDTRRVTIFSDRDWKLFRAEPATEQDQNAILAEAQRERWQRLLAFRSDTIVVERTFSLPFKVLEEETVLMKLLGIGDYQLEDEDREFENLEEDEDGEPESLYEEESGYIKND